MINGIPFTPIPGVQYKNNYLRALEVIETPSLWHETLKVSPETHLTKEIVERTVYRHLILTDLWFIVCFILEIPDVNHPFWVKQCRMVEDGPPTKTLDVWSRFHGKAVDINEIVPTPDGWKKHGDIVPGDLVFGINGKPTKVIAKTKIFTQEECYRVTFDKGYSVIVSEGHLWTVNLSSKKRLKGNKREGKRVAVISTKELAREVEHSANFKSRIRVSVDICSPVEYSEKKLPIKPYVLGCWLGDGNSSQGVLTCAYADLELIENIREGGTLVEERKSSNLNSGTFSLDKGQPGKRGTGLTSILRQNKLINNKHIPLDYKQGAIKDRLAILQGLMDTDGTCDTRGTATFSNINKTLALDVFELAAGLGLKPAFRERKMQVNGEDYFFYDVGFQAHSDGPQVFRLSRKLKRSCNGKKTRSSRHAIVSVVPVEKIPCSCIQVEAEDGRYLIGEQFIPTHNSSCISIAETIQYHLKNPEHCTCIFSYKKAAAQDFLNSIRRAYSKPMMKFAFPDILWEEPEKQAPSWSTENGVILKRKNTSRPEATIEASGLVEGMLTGRHFERRIYDDVETPNTALSPDEMEKCFSQFEMSAYLGTGKDTDVERVVGTFYHYNGPLVRIRDKKKVNGEPVYISRICPGTDDGTANGNPVLMSQERLEEERLKEHFTSQILCDPTPLGERKLKSDFLVEIAPDKLPKVLHKIMAIDPAGDNAAGSKKKDAWGIVVLGVDASRVNALGITNYYILDLFIDQMSEAAAIEQMARMYMKAGLIHQVGIEKTGMASVETYMAPYVNKLKEYGRSVSIDGETLRTLSHGGRKKMERIISYLSWPLTNGCLYISTAIPIAYRVRLKMEMDKLGAWHDDGCDAVAYGIEMIADCKFDKYAHASNISFKHQSYRAKTAVA